MRWALVLMIVVVSAGQFIKHNTWKVQTKKTKDHKESSSLILQLKRKKGKAMFFASQSSLTLSLIDQAAFESEYLTGLAHKLDIYIDFGQQMPFHYGRIDGYYKVSLRQKGERKQYLCKITYWPNKKIIIVLQKTTIQATLYPYSLAYLILLNICLSGVMILLLTVLLRRKRWSQVNAHFLIILLGWKIKKIMILWLQCRVFDAAESCPGAVITKALLVILTIKSVKIVAQVIRITYNITKSRSNTLAQITIIVTFILFLPMKYLHILIPITYSLQFQKYNHYSRLDFQVHYTLLLLNFFISMESIYWIINHKPHLSTYDVTLLVYSIVGMLVWTIMGELYQYGENNNRSSPCLWTNFDNKRFCPSCEELLYDELQTEANRLKSRERHDLIYDLWKFGVADCGHIFHQHCLLQLLKSLKSCPLIDHPSTPTPTPTLQPKSSIIQ